MKPGKMHRRYQFVSRIAAGDTEKEGPAGQRGSLFKGPDAAGEAPSPRACEREARTACRQMELPGFTPRAAIWVLL
jgi:hypothetical protein